MELKQKLYKSIRTLRVTEAKLKTVSDSTWRDELLSLKVKTMVELSKINRQLITSK